MLNLIFDFSFLKMKVQAKKKARKDPLAPKHPLSSYLEFAVSERPQVLADLGSLSIGEVGKELGRRWKNLAADEKEKYEDKSKENRERFCKEMEEYRLKNKESSESAAGATPNDHHSESVATAPLDVPLLPAADPISDPEPSPSTSSTDISDPTHSEKPDPKLEDLGFAKQKGYSFHPAMKTGQIARGSRIQVTYFGTGQTGTVDCSKWIKYSSSVEERIATPRLKKDSAFRVGLQQLKALSIKIAEGQEGTASSVISFCAQSGDRRLRKLSKDGLQREEEENSKLMKEKIFSRDQSPNKFGCRDCAWKGKFSHKARSHARNCGTRRRINIKKPKPNKYDCSGEKCNLSFPYLFQLNKHYRYLFYTSQGFKICHFHGEIPVFS